MFCMNLKYLRWPYREYIKTAENDDFSEEMLSENDLEDILVTCCANASEQLRRLL